MIALLCLALFQDPRSAQTVENRLRELEEKVAALEKKHQALAAENQALEKKAADAAAVREKAMRNVGASWVQRYASTVAFTPEQSAALEALWYGWMKEDSQNVSDAAGWKGREDALRRTLTAAQIPLLAKKVREEQEQSIRTIVGSVLGAAAVPPSRAAGFERLAILKLLPAEPRLLLQAGPGPVTNLSLLASSLEACLDDPASDLAPDEAARVRETLSRWKPRSR